MNDTPETPKPRRVAKNLELLSETWDQINEIGRALKHEEPEETVKLLVEIGLKAVAVSDTRFSTVKLLGGETQLVGEKCPKCGVQRILHQKEMAVTLIKQ